MITDDVVERLTRPIIGIENRTADEVFDIMADRIRAALSASGLEPLQARVKVLEGALEPFAAQKTIDEIMKGDEPPEWVNATPERRIELMGERKRQNTENILRARQALKQESSDAR